MKQLYDFVKNCTDPQSLEYINSVCHRNISVQILIAMNPWTPKKILYEYFMESDSSFDDTVKISALKNNQIDNVFIIDMLNRRNINNTVQIRIAENLKFSNDEKDVEDTNSITYKIFSFLSKENVYIKEAVAKNKNCPKSIIKILMNDDVDFVAIAANQTYSSTSNKQIKADMQP